MEDQILHNRMDEATVNAVLSSSRKSLLTNGNRRKEAACGDSSYAR